MMKKFFASILTICILLSPISVYANETIKSENKNYVIEYKSEKQESLDDEPEIGCKAAYVADPVTGKVFYEKRAHEKMYPASTTKILTALVVLEKCDITDTATVSKKALDLIPEGYSSAGLKVGEEHTIETLLYALLIPSANEAANVLAEHVSGSVEEFATLCNNRAEELGCENLHFVNPNGIHDDNHYCTAYDLYLIAKECQKYDVFNKIVKTTSFTVPATTIYNKNDRTYQNTNSLILPNSTSYYYSYCTGIKTGHTTPAGECLVASSSHDDIDLISVVLGGGTNSKGLNERFYDTKQLFEFVYDNYSYKEIAQKNDVIKTIEVKKATKDTASLDVIVNTDISSILPNDLDKNEIQKNVTMDEEIFAPIEQNQVLGKITYEVDGLSYTADIIASHEVQKLPYLLYNAIVVAGVFFLLIIISIILKKRKIARKKRKYKYTR